MIRINGTIWLSVQAVTAWLMLSGSMLPRCAAQDLSGGAAKPSFTQSIKQTFSKMGESFSSKPKPDSLASDDPTLLSSEAKPSVELYLSLAKYYEEANKPGEAEQQYQKALKEKPDHLAAMLSYAHFMENQGRYEDAVNLYQRAIKDHPKDASAYNNLGLCYARQKNLKDAASALGQAVHLESRSVLYRNNIAAILVEENRMQEAFEHLRSVHGDAKAYYNLGYLLNKKGDIKSAEHHFRQALLVDPKLEPAARWLSYLQNKSHSPAADRNFKTARPASSAGGNSLQGPMTRIVAPPMPPSNSAIGPQQNPYYTQHRQPAPSRAVVQELPAIPDSSAPRRLPPVTVRQPIGSAVTGDASGNSESAPAAPLPPDMTSP